MSFIAALVTFLDRHAEALEHLAINEANGKIVSISIKINRVRTAEEQVKILTSYYSNTLQALDELDELGFTSLFLMSKTLLEQNGDTLHTISDDIQRWSKVLGTTETLDEIDFEGMRDVALENIPKDHAVYHFLEGYKNYHANEHLLTGIKELFDVLESNQAGEKLSDEQVDQHTNKNTMALTASQKVLALDYLMRASGIELVKGQAAKQHRFISSITKIGQADVAKKFPPKTESPFNQTYVENLKSLTSFFEGIGANRIVSNINRDITWEEEKLID